MEEAKEWLLSSYHAGIGPAKSSGVLLLIFGLTVLVYLRMIKSSENNTTTDDLLASKGKVNSTINSKNFVPDPVENDVWEERKKRGIMPASMNKKENAAGKPFGSSYYYAHNNTNATGGYKDGLKMEDYTMNGPRLLSVNGKPATTTTTTTTTTSNNNLDIEEQKTPQSVDTQDHTSEIISCDDVEGSVPAKQIDYKDVTRYLWDDPGDASGIATIRIDKLPGKTPTETIPWKDAKITTVDAKLKDEGLLVIATAEDEMLYRLKISKLFDKATEVRSVVKPKRLLIKIYKKRNTLNFLGKSNLEPWPHPQRKHKL